MLPLFVELTSAADILKLTPLEIVHLAFEEQLILCISSVWGDTRICQVHRAELPEGIRKKFAFQSLNYVKNERRSILPDDEVKYLMLSREDCSEFIIKGKLQQSVFEKGYAIDKFNLVQVPEAEHKVVPVNEFYYDDEDSHFDSDPVKCDLLPVETHVYGFYKENLRQDLGIKVYTPQSTEIKLEDVLVPRYCLEEYSDRRRIAAEAQLQDELDRVQHTSRLKKMIMAHKLFWIDDPVDQERQSKKREVLEALSNPDGERKNIILRDPLEKYEIEIASWFRGLKDEMKELMFDSEDFVAKAVAMIRPNKLQSPQMFKSLLNPQQKLDDPDGCIFLDILKAATAELAKQGIDSREACINYLTENYYSENLAKTAAKILRRENMRKGRPIKKNLEKGSS